jgi:hypothetical protein
MERGNGFTTTVKWGGAMFNNNSNPFGSNNFGNAFGSGLDPLLNHSLDRLQLDPRDQMAHDLRMFRQTGNGDVQGLLRTRLSQIDGRDQEATDIQSLLPRIPPRFAAVPHDVLRINDPQSHTSAFGNLQLNGSGTFPLPLRRPSPPPTRQRYAYCAGKDSCDCGLPKICTKADCDCSRPKACPGSIACDCGASLKICTDPDCDCGRPKVHP